MLASISAIPSSFVDEYPIKQSFDGTVNKNGKLWNGNATNIYYHDFLRFTGIMQNGIIKEGHLTNLKGEIVYIGDFKDGKIWNGTVTKMYYTKMTVFTGTIKNGIYEGHLLNLKNVIVYTGEFKEYHIWNGNAINLPTNNNLLTGTMENGQMTKGTYVRDGKYFNIDKFKESKTCNEKNTLHRGKLILEDGQMNKIKYYDVDETVIFDGTYNKDGKFNNGKCIKLWLKHKLLKGDYSMFCVKNVYFTGILENALLKNGMLETDDGKVFYTGDFNNSGYPVGQVIDMPAVCNDISGFYSGPYITSRSSIMMGLASQMQIEIQQNRFKNDKGEVIFTGEFQHHSLSSLYMMFSRGDCTNYIPLNQTLSYTGKMENCLMKNGILKYQSSNIVYEGTFRRGKPYCGECNNLILDGIPINGYYTGKLKSGLQTGKGVVKRLVNDVLTVVYKGYFVKGLITDGTCHNLSFKILLNNNNNTCITTQTFNGSIKNNIIDDTITLTRYRIISILDTNNNTCIKITIDPVENNSHQLPSNTTSNIIIPTAIRSVNNISKPSIAIHGISAQLPPFSVTHNIAQSLISQSKNNKRCLTTESVIQHKNSGELVERNKCDKLITQKKQRNK